MTALASLLAGLLATETGEALRWMRRRVALFAIVFVLALTVYGGGLLALGFVLAPVVGAPGAAVVIALLALVAGLVLGAVLLISGARADRRRARTGQTLAVTAAVSLVPQLIRSASPLPLLVVGGLGYLLLGGLSSRRERDESMRSD